MMAELFVSSIDNIALHLKNIFKTKDVNENSVAEDFPVTVSDGKNYKTKLITAMNQALENIFETGELKEEVVSSILEHTTQHAATEGKTQETKLNELR